MRAGRQCCLRGRGERYPQPQKLVFQAPARLRQDRNGLESSRGVTVHNDIDSASFRDELEGKTGSFAHQGRCNHIHVIVSQRLYDLGCSCNSVTGRTADYVAIPRRLYVLMAFRTTSTTGAPLPFGMVVPFPAALVPTFNEKPVAPVQSALPDAWFVAKNTPPTGQPSAPAPFVLRLNLNRCACCQKHEQCDQERVGFSSDQHGCLIRVPPGTAICA